MNEEIAGQTDFLLITISDKDRFGVIALEKQLARYMRATNMPAAYTFSSLTKAQRNAHEQSFYKRENHRSRSLYTGFTMFVPVFFIYCP